MALSSQEWRLYLESVQAIRYDVARAGWIGDYLDPVTFLDMWITDGGNNNTGWSSPAYDALIAKLQEEFDPEKRREIFTKMETILQEEMPIIPLYYYTWYSMVKPYVRGLYPNMLDYHPLKWVSIDEERVSASSQASRP